MSWLSSSLSSLFGMNKKDKQPTRITSPYETPEGQQYQQSLQERIAGRGLSKETLSNTYNPYAVQSRSLYNQNVVPVINSQASARGLSKSTIPVAQIGQGKQNVENDIATKISDLNLSNENYLLQDKIAAENALMGVGEGKSSVENARLAENARAGAAGRAAASNGLLRGISTIGGAIIGGMTGGPLAALTGGISGFSNTSKSEADTAMSWIDEIFNQRKAGTVNTGGANTGYTPIVKPKLSYSY